MTMYNEAGMDATLLSRPAQHARLKHGCDDGGEGGGDGDTVRMATTMAGATTVAVVTTVVLTSMAPPARDGPSNAARAAPRSTSGRPLLLPTPPSPARAFLGGGPQLGTAEMLCSLILNFARGVYILTRGTPDRGGVLPRRLLCLHGRRRCRRVGLTEAAAAGESGRRRRRRPRRRTTSRQSSLVKGLEDTVAVAMAFAVAVAITAWVALPLPLPRAGGRPR